jgi:hypothetical protein
MTKRGKSSGSGLARLVERIGAQVTEERLDFARQGLGGGRQFAGCGEDGGCCRIGRADGLAERADIDDKGSIALRRQLGIRRDLTGCRVPLSDGAAMIDVTS